MGCVQKKPLPPAKNKPNTKPPISLPKQVDCQISPSKHPVMLMQNSPLQNEAILPTLNTEQNTENKQKINCSGLSEINVFHTEENLPAPSYDLEIYSSSQSNCTQKQGWILERKIECIPMSVIEFTSTASPSPSPVSPKKIVKLEEDLSLQKFEDLDAIELSAIRVECHSITSEFEISDRTIMQNSYRFQVNMKIDSQEVGKQMEYYPTLQNLQFMSTNALRDQHRVTKIKYNNATLANLESLTFVFGSGDQTVYSPPLGTYGLEAEEETIIDRDVSQINFYIQNEESDYYLHGVEIWDKQLMIIGQFQGYNKDEDQYEQSLKSVKLEEQEHIVAVRVDTDGYSFPVQIHFAIWSDM